MAYEPQTWADGEAGGTPLSAERLNHMEAGIDSANGDVPASRITGTVAQSKVAELPQSKVTGLADIRSELSEVMELVDYNERQGGTSLMWMVGRIAYLLDMVTNLAAWSRARADYMEAQMAYSAYLYAGEDWPPEAPVPPEPGEPPNPENLDPMMYPWPLQPNGALAYIKQGPAQ